MEENEALHDQLAEQAARMEGRSLLDSYADSSMERARMQVSSSSWLARTVKSRECAELLCTHALLSTFLDEM